MSRILNHSLVGIQTQGRYKSIAEMVYCKAGLVSIAEMVYCKAGLVPCSPVLSKGKAFKQLLNKSM